MFDDVVGAAEQRCGNLDAELLGCLEIDHEIEPPRLHDRQLGRLFSLENASDIDAGLPPCVRKIGAVAEETASSDVNAPDADRRYPVFEALYDVEVLAVETEQGIGAGEKGVHLQPAHRGEGLVEIAFAQRIDDMKGQTQGLRGFFCLLDLDFRQRPFRIDEQRNVGHLRQYLAQQPHRAE